MNNYEYIIASLPVLTSELRSGDALPVDDILDEIRSQCSGKDCQTVDFLLEGFGSDSLDWDFYLKALSHKDRFIREYFRYDLDVRNRKVAYLNRSLGRKDGQDMIIIGEEGFEDAEMVDGILAQSDILGRERALDAVMWEKIDSLTVLEVFNLEVILGFVAKLRIIDRWLKLDEQTGRSLFRKLVEEIKGGYNTEKI